MIIDLGEEFRGLQRAGQAGQIKLGLRPDSGLTYRLVDQSTGRAGSKFFFFKARSHPTGFILDGPDRPRGDGSDGPRVTGLASS